MTKSLVLLVSLLTLTGCSANRGVDRATGGPSNAYPASDERIRTLGRHLVDEDGGVRFAASGVTFFLKFRGTGLEVELEDEFRDSTSYNWFTVVVDEGEPFRFRTEPGKRRYTLADSLAPGEHTVALSKATEGQNGHNRLVAVHATELLAADPLPEPAIEFIGDSITSGYGLDSEPIACEEGTWFDQTHAWLAYGPRIARRLDARWMLSSVSGMGMHRNWNSPGPVMPDVYGGVYLEYADSTSAWDFSRFTPDLVVIALGTNDFSEGGGETPRADLDGDAFVRDYTAFVGTVRDRYPEARLLLVNSPVFDEAKKARLAGYLQQVIDNRRAAGDDTIDRFTYEGRYDAGCNGHPDLEEHLRMADELEPVVREVMGW